MTTALETRPKLHPEVKIVRREVRGEVHYVVREPTERKYYQLDEVVVTLMRLMDGKRTPEEIADAAQHTLGARPTAGVVADFAQKLKRMGIVERSPTEQHLMMQERIRKKRKVRSKQRTQGSILKLQFAFGDPDRSFGRMQQALHWMWTPGFVAVSMLFFATYLIITFAKWPEFAQGTIAVYTLNGIGPWDIVLLIAITAIITVIHELGHGLTTKALGGEIHEWGAMLLYFSPAFYCVTDDAWTFEKRSHRLWTTFAGPWIELMTATVAGVVWAVTEPGTFINWVAFLTFLIGGLSSIFSNLNPLIPLDGYYALADWLEIPRLRGGSFEYWGWLIKRRLLGVDAKEPNLTPREKRIFLAYGSLAFLYSVFVAVVGLLWLIFIFGRFIGPWIWVLVAFMAAKLVRKHAGRSRALALAARTRWKAGFLSGPSAGILAIAVVVIVALPFLLPWTYRARGEFTVEAAPPAPIRAQVDGILDQLFAVEGDTVVAGTPLAVLWNPQLESEYLDRQAEARRLGLRRARAEARRDLSEAADAAATLVKVNEELEVLRVRRDRLVLRAPGDGTLLGYRLHERIGERLAEGDELAEIASLHGRMARIRVPLKQAGELEVGQPAGLRLLTRPDLEFRSIVASVAPAAEDGMVEVIVHIPSVEWQPAPGMSGIAKIETRRATLAHAIARAWRQTVRVDLWL
ncbi:MAG: efflux RND transporter periplasmic adaptor subunit [Gemmatimonadetes bacterium]|nr:efflux RND transporter periplasmic adaptor subunit [Gemmatimonadota bacterium]